MISLLACVQCFRIKPRLLLLLLISAIHLGQQVSVKVWSHITCVKWHLKLFQGFGNFVLSVYKELFQRFPTRYFQLFALDEYNVFRAVPCFVRPVKCGTIQAERVMFVFVVLNNNAACKLSGCHSHYQWRSHPWLEAANSNKLSFTTVPNMFTVIDVVSRKWHCF